MTRMAGRMTGVLIFLAPLLASACEGCKSSAQSGGAPNAIGEAFGLSIYFMLAVPTLIMIGMTRMIIRQCRALDRQHAQLLAPVASDHATDDLNGLGDAIAAR